ncbi:hypothetical protein ACFLYA_00005, partial [Candidatus Dependentiae bacterium]
MKKLLISLLFCLLTLGSSQSMLAMEQNDKDPWPDLLQALLMISQSDCSPWNQSMLAMEQNDKQPLPALKALCPYLETQPEWFCDQICIFLNQKNLLQLMFVSKPFKQAVSLYFKKHKPI